MAPGPSDQRLVIEHTDGLVVFDAGQDRASVTDPDYFPHGPSGVIYRRLSIFHVDDDETMTVASSASAIAPPM